MAFQIEKSLLPKIIRNIGPYKRTNSKRNKNVAAVARIVALVNSRSNNFWNENKTEIKLRFNTKAKFYICIFIFPIPVAYSFGPLIKSSSKIIID